MWLLCCYFDVSVNCICCDVVLFDELIGIVNV